MNNNTVLITGGAGSIGSRLVVDLVLRKMNPKHIIVVDNSEYNLYDLEQEISKLELKNKAQIEYLISDVRDTYLLGKIFKKYNPDTVYHAAALKHVPMLETPHNALEGIRTNIGGTISTLTCAIHHKVKSFVLVSTDKAVNPISMMGATKTYAEGYCRELSKTEINTSISIVRFGNVIGSSGSVIPLFKKQIEYGGPVTVTHKDMVRYFMSIGEAVHLVINSSTLNSGTYILDMGTEVSISALAKDLIDESGNDIDIIYTGVRAGEKFKEELHYDHEILRRTDIDKVLRVVTSKTYEYYASNFQELMYSCNNSSLECTLKVLKKVVPYTGGIVCETL